MEFNQLFQVALGIRSPWFIEKVQLNEQTNNLEIKVDFTPGAKFACPVCNTECPCYDTTEKRWLLPEQIQSVCSDLSPAFILGIRNNFPKAIHVFDKFHVVKIVNKAVDETRAKESKANDLIRNCKYGLLKNPENLTMKQKIALDNVLAEYTHSGEAYKFKLGFQDLFKLPSRAEAELYLLDWITSVKQSKIPQMQKLAKSIKRQWNGILSWFDHKISNGKVEALNCGIQNLKRLAKGFRTLANFEALIYLVMGKLSF